MRKEKNRAWVFWIVFVLIPPWAHANSRGPWKSMLDPVLRRAKLKQGSYGIEIRKLHDGKLLFADGETHALNPASSIKVLTAATALSKLGPNYRFYTVVLRSGQDVCLKGQGDPSLVSETMWLLVEEARRHGLGQILGNLIVDDSFFTASKSLRQNFPGDRNRSFTAPISALSLNYNSLTIYVKPTKLGKPAQIHLEPEPSLFRVINRVKTTLKSGRRDVNAWLHAKGDQIEIHVDGKIGKNQKRITLYRAVPEPALYAGHVFAHHLSRAGGGISGKIVRNVCPSNAREIFRFKSKPLSQVVFGLNKFSNNFIAEMLIQALGAQNGSQHGLKEMRNWLKAQKINAQGLVLENGSGLSRENRISAHTLTSIVRQAANDMAIGPEFLASFGISGVDGTLRHRFSHPSALSKVRAKSGSLKGVVSLTGVINIEHPGPVVFAFLFASAGKNWVFQKLEERLILKILSAKSIDSIDS